MLSLFWVLFVVEQPTVNANRAMTPITLNEVRICFIFVSFLIRFDLVSTIIRIQGFFNYFFFCCTFVTLLSHVCHFPKLRRVPTGESDRSCERLTKLPCLIFIRRTSFLGLARCPSNLLHG